MGVKRKKPMHYARILKNDTANGEGVCVTVFTQGCTLHCEGCHNPEFWDYNGGKIWTAETQSEVLEALCANGVQRNLCVMGGEPLSKVNLIPLTRLIKSARNQNPNIKVFLWTGKTKDGMARPYKRFCRFHIDYLIDGPFILKERDITLKMRGSRNQNIYKKNEEGEFELYEGMGN